MTMLYIAWFIAALLIIIVEMNVMTFYLMAVALGAIAGGLGAYFELTLSNQFMLAGVVTIVAACFSFWLRRKFKSHMDKQNNELDRGQRVVVKADKIREDGTADVTYRGTDWRAYKENAVLTPGIYFIVRVDGTQLVLGDKIPTPENADGTDTAAETTTSTTIATDANNTEKDQDPERK